MNLRASILVISAALLWTSAGWAGDLTLSNWPPLLLAEARLLIGGGALVVSLGPRRVWREVIELPASRLALAVLAMAGAQWTFFVAVSGMGSGSALLLATAVSPFATDALDRELDHRGRGLAWKVAFVLLCIAALQMAGAGLMQWLAVLAAVGSGIAYAVYAQTSAKFSHAASARPGGPAIAAISLTGAGLLLTPVALRGNWPALTAPSLIVIAYLGLVATALPYGLFAQGLRVLSASQALSLLALQPLAGIAFDLLVRPGGASGVSLCAVVLIIAAHIARSAAWRIPFQHRRHAGTALRDGSHPKCH